MDELLDQLLDRLDDTLDQKCSELRIKKQSRFLQRFFVTACILFLTIPVWMTVWGVNMIVVCTPFVLFSSWGLFSLTPMIFFSESGGTKDETI